MNNNKSPFLDTQLSSFIQCIDYTVSRETFSLLKNNELEMLITSPQPKIEDLGKYYESEDYISHTDSKKSTIDKIYHRAKNYAIKKKVKLINNLFIQTNQKPKTNLDNYRENTILDIGCGTGDFLVACKNDNWNVVGVEPNKSARVLSKSKLGVLKSKSENFGNSNSKIQESINELDDEKFDVITMWHVLEHVPNLEEYISQLKELLKENGTLIIAVPNFKSFDAKHYKQFWAAYDVPRHLWHFSQKSIKLLFKKENMNVVKTLPMKLDSFYVSLLSEKYKTGKSNFIKPFFVGLISNLKAKRTKEYSSLIYIIKNA